MKRREELDKLPQQTPEEQDIYTQKVNEYNALVAEYNVKVSTLKTEIAQYNAQVRAFNECIKE
jgi:uncharacterized coiled-coil DUF342 family protein